MSATTPDGLNPAARCRPEVFMSASKAQRAETAKRRSQALALRLAGMDFQTIADRLGYAGRAAASKDITRALEAGLADQRANADVLIATEISRLDRMQTGLWPAAAAGDPRAVDTVLKIIDRRARFLKLDKGLDDSGYAASVLGTLAAGLGLADAQLRAQGAYDDLPAGDDDLTEPDLPHA